MVRAYISLGSNLDNRLENIDKAISLLDASISISIEAVSPIYETEPVEVENHPKYLNNVIKINTMLAPDELLTTCKEIEQEMGRRQKGVLKPRIIDIDILLYENKIVESSILKIPHPRMKARAFMLKPLIDLSPNLKCPITGELYSNLLSTDFMKKQKIEIFEGGGYIGSSILHSN